MTHCASQESEESAAANLPKCMSLKPLSPAEEKIILMESGGEDLRRLRQMKPLPTTVQQRQEKRDLQATNSLPISHKRRRHKAYRQSSDVSLFEELANSIEEDSPLPELCIVAQASDSDETTSSQDFLNRKHTTRKYILTETEDTSADFSSIYKTDQESSFFQQVTVSPQRVFKVIFVGDSDVGKSSLIRRICKNTFAGD